MNPGMVVILSSPLTLGRCSSRRPRLDGSSWFRVFICDTQGLFGGLLVLYSRRTWLALVGTGLVASVGQAQADPVALSESVGVGSLFQYELTLAIDGKMKVSREGRLEAIPLVAKASHRFVERVENPDARGGVGRAIRVYQSAVSDSTTGPERQVRELPADRRLIVVQRSAQGSIHFSPDGPLTREELDLVAEHFDTLCLTGLLPTKPVAVGDTWPIDAETAQYACLLEGLLKAELVGKLQEVKDGIATFSISGTAEGIESAAIAKMSISATGQFDITNKRLVELSWEQGDDRQAGPVSPGSEFKAVVRLKRTAISEEPKEITAEVRAKIPAEGKVAPSTLALRYTDSQSRYQLLFAREWHIVGKTPEHLVLRLVEGNELSAQATLTSWKKAEPGKALSPDDFKKIVATLRNWEPEKVLSDGYVPVNGDRKLYCVAAQGKQDGVPVVQLFYFLSDANGQQMAITVLSSPEKAGKLNGRDQALVQAIDFQLKK